MYVSAFTIGMGYLLGGIIPLVPYFFIPRAHVALIYSSVITGIVLLIFGAVKARVTGAAQRPSRLCLGRGHYAHGRRRGCRSRLRNRQSAGRRQPVGIPDPWTPHRIHISHTYHSRFPALEPFIIIIHIFCNIPSQRHEHPLCFVLPLPILPRYIMYSIRLHSL